MRTGTFRVVSVVALATMLAGQQSTSLSAQHPGQFQGYGWLVAYGGGASPGGALGPSSDAVSPPVALGTGAGFSDISDVATTGGHTVIARRDGSVWTYGGGDLHQIASLVDVYRVATGGNASFAIDTAGILWEWTQAAPTPVISALGDVTAVDANARFAVAARWDGVLFSWDHVAGSAPVNVATPPDFWAVDVAIGDSIAAARSFAGDVVIWDPSTRDSVEVIASGVASVAAGGHHVVIARNYGSVQTIGANSHGQLGDGSLNSSSTLVTVAGLTNIVDVAAGASHSVAVASNGVAYSWGSNTHRQLLAPTATAHVTMPVRVMDVPRTARYAVAKGDTTVLMGDPGSLAVTHNIEAYPFEFQCGQPVDASVFITGFDATGGLLNQAGPGLTDITMSIHVAPEFVRTGPVTVSDGSVAVSGSQITWTMSSLGASTASLNLRLLPSGPEGEFPVFSPFTYVSAQYPEPTTARHPVAFHRECAPPDVEEEEEEDTEPPVISSVTPSRATLAPPNNQMVPVAVTVAATDNVSTPACSITGVTSNESITGDVQILAPLDLMLRAERNGHGNGRTYRIAVTCVDDAGNSASGSTIVTVPRGKQHPHGKVKPKEPKGRGEKDQPRKK